MNESPRGRPQAIVRPKAAGEIFDVERLRPRESLAPFVDYLWLVRWRTASPYEQQVVPQPRVHIAAEEGRLYVHGVNRDPFFRTLRDDGHVLGAAFHSGGFRPVLGDSVGALTERVMPASDLFGEDDRPAARTILGTSRVRPMVDAFEDYLEARSPRPDPAADDINALVSHAESTTSLTRAGDLATYAGVGLRTLQRLFTEYVGIGPKWVIQRLRLLDAARAAHDGDDVDWATLAVDLGFSDQAHLTRLFTRVVGTPPASYARDPDTR